MPFAAVHGITLPIRREQWKLVPDIVGADDERADDGSLLTSETTRKRKWETGFTIGRLDEREALRRLVEGDGLHVDFNDASGYSFHGLGPKTSTSTTFSASGGKRGGKAAVGSAGVLEYAMANFSSEQDGLPWAATKGWTLCCFKFISGVWRDLLATGSVVVTRGAAANPAGVTQFQDGVAGTYGMGHFIDVAADGDVGVHGYDAAGAAGAFDYDELLFLPFAFPSHLAATWAAQLAAFRSTSAAGRLPFVKLSGDCIPDAQPLEVRWRVTQGEQRRVILDGAFRNNAREDVATVSQV